MEVVKEEKIRFLEGHLTRKYNNHGKACGLSFTLFRTMWDSSTNVGCEG